ncbi:XTP/dITP diphosphatase [Macrococcus brunensis]|uniref:dITP/XTP pyrophosphatase n=1 Tax=Macrococcus brunensis TaxID=198483 RepID=A0A4R6BCZ6_9STAP|nr:XTP/dITP diphosphatase [Macrococcus brunensis]TDL96726.1 XTP/dITP diphosphatase [Macrococcus brunensis]ULG71253.1 XTP/dITP diphosphatase [Macrococcus brunensis]ULG73563.1 XTP/dITP diphosphatase [Macrococcus brunensis]
MKDIVIATGNQGKINDFKHIFPEHNVIGITTLLPDFDVEETGTTFEENAALKAEAASHLLGKTVIADDSGLSVDSLNGAPGIYSARYAGTEKDDAANIKLLLKNLQGESERAARFVCVIALSEPGHPTQTFRGEVEGVIAEEERGEHGFGYDPIFYLPERDQTMAELVSEEKAEISHRRKAIDKLTEYLEGQTS